MPSALPPSRPTLRHRLRARRARRAPGVRIEGLPLLGRAVVLDASDGGSIELADGCVLMDGCRIHARGGAVRIGAGAVLGDRCVLISHAGIEIGERAILGDEVLVQDFEQLYTDVEQPVRLQGVTAEPVVIGAGARVGVAAALQRGVNVRPGAVVGPRAVVAGR